MRKLSIVLLATLALFGCGGGGTSLDAGSSNGGVVVAPPLLGSGSVLSITMNPATVGLNSGQTRQIIAFANLSGGGQQEVTTTATWASDNTAVATVSPFGVVTAGNQTGTANITANFGGKVGTTVVTVNGGIPPGVLTLTPDNKYLEVSTSLQLVTEGAQGTLTFTSSNTTLATVNENGLVSGVAPGSVTITASTPGQTATVRVNVFSANVFLAASTTPAGIQGTVDAFRADLGALNPNVTTQFPNGRREINWDGVPPAQTNTDAFLNNFFNTTSPRGVIFTTTNGTGFRVSDNLFADVNATYPTQLQTFSANKLFSVRGSTTFDTQFFLAASTTPGFSRGFGAVFVDPDNAGISRLEFVLADGSVFARNVANLTGSQGLSFLGVSFQGASASRVTLVTGDNSIAGANNDVTNGGSSDIVVVDDFIYGEPQPTP